MFTFSDRDRRLLFVDDISTAEIKGGSQGTDVARM